jgi:hypothetical protein
MQQEFPFVHEDSPVYTCKGVFSQGYLKKQAALQAPDDDAYRTIAVLLESTRAGLVKAGEPYTRTHFIDKILSLLGWDYLTENALRGFTGACKKPDYSLYPNREALEAAAAAPLDTDAVRLALTVLEAKRFRHPLDAVSQRETPHLFPCQQLQEYLRLARDERGQRFFDWAILTNGNEWRLYTERSSADAYFAFTLVNPDGSLCTPADFTIFRKLFSPDAFVRRPDGACALDDVQTESVRVQTELETNLKRRVFDVLEELATAFADQPENAITPDDYPAVYDASLVFLYRLLFVLYAESRGLLPVRVSGFGHNKQYIERYSLVWLTDGLRKPESFAEDAFTTLYERLLQLFELIDGKYPARNEACGVTRYNGGLFRSHALIARWRVGDARLAAVLKQLIFAQPPARSGDRQMRILTDETIDYASLHVRQLGDIYEGLLGGRLVRENGRLRLKDESGEKNHRDGIIYTPDWIVGFLVRETLAPLLDELDASPEIRRARAAKSDERRRDNAFAYAALRLNLVDPAMGSGHFLVRAVEWLADRIVDHPTTRRMTGRIVATGADRRTREAILAAGLIPVPPGVPQEQAETAYWRRRIVESCIYGVDLNPMAVELAKLALWLTCIAADEPLNFLDHHLMCGNSLVYARPDEINRLPARPGDSERFADFSSRLPALLSAAVRRNLAIEAEASTKMEIVKNKESAWRKVQDDLAPLVVLADLWANHLARAEEPLTDLEWREQLQHLCTPDAIPETDRPRVAKAARALGKQAQALRATLRPFHWQILFPDVFHDEDGTPLPDGRAGFDAVLGNPPYVSTHTSAGAGWRDHLAARDGYLDDLYVHFTGLGYALLRTGGRFGFIVSDTFFTLASKLRMRQLLQDNRLHILGQCDPFDVTVDAAIFVAEKTDAARPAPPDATTLFIQARPRREDGVMTRPDLDLPELPTQSVKTLNAQRSTLNAQGAATAPEASPLNVERCELSVERSFRSLRLHRVPTALFRDAHKHVFFEPRHGTLALYDRFNQAVKTLTADWLSSIETSEKFSQNREALAAYHATLKPGDVTLVGLIAEGGQGMRTANNARFLGYLQGTPQAAAITAKRDAWTRRWLSDAPVKERFLELLKQHGGNPARPLSDPAAWEACVEPLCEAFDDARLGFNKTGLYRIVPAARVVTDEDFAFAWQRRKQELWDLWRKAPELQDFWAETADLLTGSRTVNPKAKTVTDTAFCAVCQEALRWLAARKTKTGSPRTVLGLRSSEEYADPAGAPRVAAIYNGFSGRGTFVPFRKGDPEGNRWYDNEPLFIDWSSDAVNWLSSSPKARWQGHRFFFTPGVTWSLHANHVCLKARFQPECVFDASGSRLVPVSKILTTSVFLAVLNSDIFSFFLKKFIKHNQDVEINDLRQMPLVMPTRPQERQLKALAEGCLEAKRLALDAKPATQALAATARQWISELRAVAPQYLQPPAQACTLQSPEDCLAVFELAVNWHAEKLYGVEGLGPFDEF